MAEAAYQRAFRKAQVALAQQQGKQDAMKAAGLEPQPQEQKQARTPPRSPVAKNQRAARRKPASLR